MLTVIQATGTCLSPSPSRRRRLHSTKDKRKVSPECADGLSSLLLFFLPLLVTSRTFGERSDVFLHGAALVKAHFPAGGRANQSVWLGSLNLPVTPQLP